MDDINDLLSLISAHKWVPVAALAIHLALRVCKDDRFVAWFPYVIAPRWRSLAAMALGVLSGVLDAVVGGTKWPAALIGGLVSAITAITTQDVVINGIRNGREFGVPKDGRSGGSGSGTPPISMKAPPPGKNVGPYSSNPPAHMTARILLVGALLASMPGCAWTAKNVRPIIDTTQSALNQASFLLDAIRSAVNLFFLIHPAPPLQAEIERKIADASLAADGANSLLKGVKELSDGQSRDAFASWNKAYDELLVALHDANIVAPEASDRRFMTAITAPGRRISLPIRPISQEF